MVTTNLPNGVTNAQVDTTLGSYIAPDPTKAHVFFDDFDTFVASGGPWTVTVVDDGTDGGEVTAVDDADGGVLTLTTNDADDDANYVQFVNETFLFEKGKRLWFKTRFQVDDAEQSDVAIGLYVTDTSPIASAPTDGVYFLKPDGDQAISLKVGKDSTYTTVPAAEMEDDTWITLGFVYDGVDKIDIFVNDQRVASAPTTNLPDDEELTVSFAIQAGEAAAKTMLLDYVFVAKER